MVVAAAVGISLTNALIIFGIVGVVVFRLLEATGRLPSSKIQRETISDQRARIDALEEAKAYAEEVKAEKLLELAASKANELQLLARIEALELKVRDLESRDQAAVLAALKDHETGAVARAKKTNGLQQTTIERLERMIEILDPTEGEQR